MTHVQFDPDSINWSSVVSASNPQAGFGRFFEGTRYQRGFGNMSGGGVFHNIIRFLKPIAKNLAASAGSEGISAGARMLKDVSEGRNLKESLIEHSKQGLENLASKVQQCGKGKKSVGGKGRKREVKSLYAKGPYLAESSSNLVPPIGSQGIGPKRRKRKTDQLDF